MKAIQILGPKHAVYHDVSTPVARPGEVLIRVRCTGICGTDIEIYDGVMPFYTQGMAHYPVIPGHEWVGEIVGVGDGVTGFAVGDHVVGECSVGCGQCPKYCGGSYHQCVYRTETGILNHDGGFAEYLAFPTTFLHKISPDVPFQSACLVEPSAVAFNGVKKAQVSPQDRAAIYGDGPIGLLVLQAVKVFGAQAVIVVGATPRRLEAAETMGADAVVNVQEQDPIAFIKRQLGQAADVVLEATGNPHAAQQAVQSVRLGGRIALLGIFAGHPASITLDSIVLGDVTLYGSLGSPHVWQDVIPLIETGKLDPAAIVTHNLSLPQFEDGIELTRQRAGIKVVLSQEA